MGGEQLNLGFNLDRAKISDTIGFNVSFPVDYDLLIPPKEIVSADGFVPLSHAEATAFLRAIPLKEDSDVKPYKDAEFSFFSVSPSGLHTPQRFVLEEKVMSLLKGLDALYQGFSFPKLAARGAHYIYGKDRDGNKRVALYMPPLVEKKNGTSLLIDGNHRATLCHQIGATTEVIGVRGSSVEPPYEGLPWNVNFVTEKPPLEARYHNFKPELLKDFDHVGIDG